MNELHDIIRRAGGWRKIKHDIPGCLVALASIAGTVLLILGMAPVHH